MNFYQSLILVCIILFPSILFSNNLTENEKEIWSEEKFIQIELNKFKFNVFYQYKKNKDIYDFKIDSIHSANYFDSNICIIEFETFSNFMKQVRLQFIIIDPEKSYSNLKNSCNENIWVYENNCWSIGKHTNNSNIKNTILPCDANNSKYQYKVCIKNGQIDIVTKEYKMSINEDCNKINSNGNDCFPILLK